MNSNTFFYILAFFSFQVASCQNNGSYAQTNTKASTLKKSQDAIIEKYLKKGAYQYHYNTKEWHEWIDKGLAQDSSIALLWQRKALPYWKARKYEIALKYYDKAVLYNRAQYLSRRGFLKCVFMKAYQSALKDLTAYEQAFGITYENDHSTTFYRALCHLALNQFEASLRLLKPLIAQTEASKGKKWVHHLEYFYLGVVYYELGRYNEALGILNSCLHNYDNFSDAKYWKAHTLIRLGQASQGLRLLKEAKKDFEDGYTVNEDSNFYELYPYQITWQWDYIIGYWEKKLKTK